MKIKSSLIIASALLGLAQFTHAQCPEICDSNQNTALGQSALVNNSSGMNNTAVGFQALQNSNADGNTATGYQALKSNTSGTFNSAYGQQALSSSTFGIENTAFGAFALAININGSNNTAVGYEALSRSTTNSNTALGWNALTNDTSGSGNIAIGVNAGGNLTTGGNNIDIGNVGITGEANTIRIGARAVQQDTYIAGISGRTVAGGVGVLITSNGHLGTNTSSARFKEQIKPMDKASEALLSLKPVTFRYKKELDSSGIPQFGLVAEEVAKINPDLVARDEEGKPYSVRYEAVNAMLLNEFLKEHRTVQEQAASITKQDDKIGSLEAAVAQQQKASIEQQKEIKALTSAVQEQASQIQKVSLWLTADKSAPRVVHNAP